DTYSPQEETRFRRRMEMMDPSPVSILYCLWVQRNTGGPMYEDGDRYSIVPQVPVSHRDVYELDLTSVSIREEATAPLSLILHQNYPNPFQGMTTIMYALPEPASVTLTVHDMLGREVRRIVDGLRGTGMQLQHFDARGLPPGNYLLRLRSGGMQKTRVMSILR
ncbi:MAG: T9SS type A sorting domain-containing protein, partial [Bacteroidetes bacterium]|nr:T9SS type A sorting domain-containing protein [Bacteroidota bacterium]